MLYPVVRPLPTFNITKVSNWTLKYIQLYPLQLSPDITSTCSYYIRSNRSLQKQLLVKIPTPGLFPTSAHFLRCQGLNFFSIDFIATIISKLEIFFCVFETRFLRKWTTGNNLLKIWKGQIILLCKLAKGPGRFEVRVRELSKLLVLKVSIGYEIRLTSSQRKLDCTIEKV